MNIVDSHCHVSDYWYEPVEVLLGQMDRNSVAQAILIQMMGQANNAYQAACVRKYPGRFASVVIVDTDRADAPATLARLANEGASGVRFRAMTRSPGDDPLAIWRAAARLGLAVSCGGAAAEFASPDFAALVQAVPDARIVVEHLGSLNHPVDAAQEELRQKVFGLSRFPNVSIKIHGLGEFCRRALPVTEPFPFERPIPPLLEEVYRAFGPNRMMWGSDYPPVSGREGYHLALNLTMEQLASKSDSDRAAIFGGTALAAFPVRG
jgi:L-fuconolactonase